MSPLPLVGRTHSSTRALSFCNLLQLCHARSMTIWRHLPSFRRSLSLVRQYMNYIPLAEFKLLYEDQDLLANFFKGKWKPLPYVYNALKTLRIIHQPLWRDEHVRCLHYILTDKPWMQPRGSGGDYETVNQWWWDRYDSLKGLIKESHPESWALIEAQVIEK